MARRFTAASSEGLKLSLGGIGVFATSTCAVIVRAASDSAASGCLFQGGDGSDTATWEFYVLPSASSNNLNYWNGTVDIKPSTMNLKTADGWCLVAVTKATGTNAPRFHKYVYSTNTWTHADGTTTGANSGTPATGNNIGRYANPTNGHFLDGDVAAVGVWQTAQFTDAQIESLAFSLSAWWQVSPSGLWLLDQAATAQKVIDTTGGGANESGITGTTVGTSSLPVFSYGHPVIARPFSGSPPPTTLEDDIRGRNWVALHRAANW